MHPVRAVRLALGAFMLLVAAIAAWQGDWTTAGLAVVGSGFAAFAGVGVKDRAELEVARDGGWQHLPPWRSPLMDILLVVMLFFMTVPVVLHALPA